MPVEILPDTCSCSRRRDSLVLLRGGGLFFFLGFVDDLLRDVAGDGAVVRQRLIPWPDDKTTPYPKKVDCLTLSETYHLTPLGSLID